MSRLLLIIAIAAVGWYLYRRLMPGGSTPSAGTPPPADAGTPPPVMHRCAECGVHAAENDGVRYQNLFFCTPAHLDDYLRKRGPG